MHMHAPEGDVRWWRQLRRRVWRGDTTTATTATAPLTPAKRQRAQAKPSGKKPRPTAGLLSSLLHDVQQAVPKAETD
jgi:hypothetical protein